MTRDDTGPWVWFALLFVIAIMAWRIWIGVGNFHECRDRGFSKTYCYTHL